MQDLGTLGGTDSYGYAINDSGQVTGYADTADDDLSRLPLGRHEDAGPRHAGGHVLVRAYAINDSGQVTGVSARPAMRPARLPVGRHEDAGPRHAGGHV